MTGGCHAGLFKHEVIHAPVQDGECLSCHTRISSRHPQKGVKNFRLAAENAALCCKCHPAVTGKKKYAHSPAAEGDCLGCHEPHGSRGAYLLDISGGDEKGLCLECHDAEPFQDKFSHGPAAMGACSRCHDPHESDHKSLLRQNVKTLCYGCHEEFAGAAGSESFIHTPVREKPCTRCHQAHSAPYPGLLNMEMTALCFECHNAAGRKYRSARTKHTALYTGRKCGNCHTLHFSENDNLLVSQEMELCLSCHGKDDFHKSDALKNIRKELADRKYLHGPVNEKRCAVCHSPHGSDNFRLLTGKYPATFYARYRKGEYGFCLKCHEENLLRFPDTSVYTAFRNGKENLHYLHVVKNKGRTCRVCHEAHAAESPKLINKEGPPFGNWRIPIRFIMTETGGSCAPGCHRIMKYDRKRPVDYGQELPE